MSFPKYEAYKDSGVEWLGEVPEHWDLCFAKYMCQEITDGAHISPDTENGIHHFISIKDIEQGFIDFDNALLTSEDNFQYLIKTGCKPAPGDVLFSKDGTIGQTAITPAGKDFVVASSLIIIKPNNKRVKTKFLDYSLQGYLVQEQVNSFVKGAALRRLSIQNLLKVWAVFPGLDEQAKIAHFLDHETARIDALIAEQQRLIKLLKEKRQAVISHAVTKGLDPTTPMKDSGVEWLGEVPTHWIVKKLGFIGEAIIGLTYSPDDVVDKGLLVLRSSNVQNGRISFHDNVFVNAVVPQKLIVRERDILICSRNGSRDLIGKNALIDKDSEGMTFGAFMTVYRSQINQFLFWVFNSHIFSAQAGSFMTSTVNQLTTGTLNSFLVPVPSLREQTDIAHFLEHETARIDTLIAEAREVVSLLQERRSALISAAVTGKIDVRGWQGPASASPAPTLEPAHG